MSVEINPPFRVFSDVDGDPLEDGYIYVGAVNQNPQAVPVSVFWDFALTIPAAQPIRTLGGYPSRSGTPSRMYIAESGYSISVLNKNSTLIYSDLNNQSGDPALRQDLADSTDLTKGAGMIGFDESLAYPAGTAGGELKTINASRRVSVLDYGAVGDGTTDDTAAFTAAAADANVIYAPYTASSYRVLSGVVNASSMFIFEGPSSQLTGTATAAQLRAMFFDGGQIGGLPFIDALRSSKIGIVAGVIRQDSGDRTQWTYLNDANHTPVGVSGAFATASGGTITISYDQAYSRVISFIAGPDETLSNALGGTCGASVGLSSANISAAAAFNGAFTVSYNGATWDIGSGTGQNIAPVFTSYTAGTLTISHGYCRGIAAQLTPYTAGGAILNPYIPVLKAAGNTSIQVQFMDPTTGNVLAGAAPADTRMKFLAVKNNNMGLFLDGTNDATVINGVDLANANIWFFGIFEK